MSSFGGVLAYIFSVGEFIFHPILLVWRWRSQERLPISSVRHIREATPLIPLMAISMILISYILVQTFLASSTRLTEASTTTASLVVKDGMYSQLIVQSLIAGVPITLMIISDARSLQLSSGRLLYHWLPMLNTEGKRKEQRHVDNGKTTTRRGSQRQQQQATALRGDEVSVLIHWFMRLSIVFAISLFPIVVRRHGTKADADIDVMNAAEDRSDAITACYVGSVVFRSITIVSGSLGYTHYSVLKAARISTTNEKKIDKHQRQNKLEQNSAFKNFGPALMSITTIVIICFNIIGQYSWAFRDHHQVASSNLSASLLISYSVFDAVAHALLFIYLFRVLYLVIRDYGDDQQLPPYLRTGNLNKRLTTHRCCSVAYLIFLCARQSARFFVSVYFDNPNWSTSINNMSYESVRVLEYIDIAYLALITIVPGYFSESQASGLIDYVDSRQKFVGYISHEIRTPLNTVLVGNTYIRDEISSMMMPCASAGLRRNSSRPNVAKCSQLGSAGNAAQEEEVKAALDDPDLSDGGGEEEEEETKRERRKRAKGETEGCAGAASSSAHTKTSSRKFGQQSCDAIVDTLDVVLDSCHSALDILNDLLLFDKMEAGKVQLDLAQAPVVSFVSSSVRPFEVQAREKNVNLTFSSSDTMQSLLADYVVSVDIHKMNQVLRNLLSNAIKFTPPSGSITVSLDASPAIDHLLVVEKPTSDCENDSRSSKSGNGNGGASMILSNSSPTGSFLGGTSASPPPASVAGTVGKRAKRRSRTVAVTEAPLPARSRNLSFLANAASGIHLSTMKDAVSRSSYNTGKVSPRGDQVSMASSHSLRLLGDVPPGFVRIEVVDTGAGISPENQKKLFGQYVQFNAATLQKGGGTGLGLWISKSIVEMHGGTIGAVSEGEGKGCTFFLELPLIHAPKGASRLLPPPDFHIEKSSDKGRHWRPLSGAFSRKSSAKVRPLIDCPRGGPSPPPCQLQNNLYSLSATAQWFIRKLSTNANRIGGGSSTPASDAGGGRQLPRGKRRWSSSNGDMWSPADAAAAVMAAQLQGMPFDSRGLSSDSNNHNIHAGRREFDNTDHRPRRRPHSSFLSPSSTVPRVQPPQRTIVGLSERPIIFERVLPPSFFGGGGSGSGSGGGGGGEVKSSRSSIVTFAKIGLNAPSGDGSTSPNRNFDPRWLPSEGKDDSDDDAPRATRIEHSLRAEAFLSDRDKEAGLQSGVDERAVCMDEYPHISRPSRNAMVYCPPPQQSILSGGSGAAPASPPLTSLVTAAPAAPPPTSTPAGSSVANEKHAEGSSSVGYGVGSQKQGSPRAELELRFLLVDDSPMNRKMVKRLLEAQGHSVVEAEDGLECLKVVRAAAAAAREVTAAPAGKTATKSVTGNPIDVILMDNNMPNMNGMEATQILRSEGYRGIIFGVTGDVMEEDVQTFLDSGATAVMEKPLDVHLLEEKLRALLLPF